MRTTLSAFLLSMITISAPAFAAVRKHVAEQAAPVVEAKPAETKTSAPATDSKVVHPRKTRRVKAAEKSTAAPSETKAAVPEVAPAK